MHVGQSLVAKKNELMAETAASTTKEDLEKLQEAVRKDNQVLEKWKTLATDMALLVDYKLTLMEVRQYINIQEGLLASFKKLLKGMKTHPDKHTERAITDMEEQVQILSEDRVELIGYLGLMEEELLMPWVPKPHKSPE